MTFSGDFATANAGAIGSKLSLVANQADERILPPFCRLFVDLTKGMKVREIVSIMQIDSKTVYRIRNGDQDMVALDQGLRFARHFGISPWAWAGVPEPVVTMPPNAAETGSPSLDRPADQAAGAALEAVAAELAEVRRRLEALESRGARRRTA